MQVFFDDRQFGHAPDFYFRLGVNIPHPEQPERARLLREVLVELGHDIIAPGDFGLDPIYAVHDPDYVDFFRTAYDRWVEGTGYTHPAIPNYHTGRRVSRVPNGVVGKLGYYATDTSCPVMKGTWDAIYWSAQCAVDAARLVAAGEGPAYALCRPPGHHASRDASNGFCFFNNAAVAAQELRGTFAKVAILDMDMHAGNGTDRGGNLFTCYFFEELTNLHEVWDELLINNEELSYTEWTDWLTSKITAEDVLVWSAATPGQWADESAAIRDQIYPDSQILSYDYVYKTRGFLRQQLSKGGVRLAAYLNEMFADETVAQAE